LKELEGLKDVEAYAVHTLGVKIRLNLYIKFFYTKILSNLCSEKFYKFFNMQLNLEGTCEQT